MTLTVRDGVDAEAGAAIGAANRFDLALSLGSGNAAGTIRRNPQPRITA